MPFKSNKPDVTLTFGKFSIIIDMKIAERINMKRKARRQRDKKFAREIRAKLKTL